MPEELKGAEASSPGASNSEGGETSPANNENNNMIPKERLDDALGKLEAAKADNLKKQGYLDEIGRRVQQNPEAAKAFLDPESAKPKPPIDDKIDFDDMDATQKVYNEMKAQIEAQNKLINQGFQNIGKTILAQQGETLEEAFEDEFSKLGYSEKDMGTATYNEWKKYYKDNMQASVGGAMQTGQRPNKRFVINAVRKYHDGIQNMVKTQEKTRAEKLKQEAANRGNNFSQRMPPGEPHLAGDEEAKPKTIEEARAKLNRNFAAVQNQGQK